MTSTTPFRRFTPAPQDGFLEMLPASAQVDTETKALALAAEAIKARRFFSLRALPLGRWEFRTRDAAWLARITAGL